MTADLVIDVRHLGKRYALRTAGPGYRTLRDALAGAFRRSPKAEPFWAVRDVSFQVRKGEVLGVVGRNGAGKSTLLKLLARITEPTEGEADIHGRVGSLLEVGTGFHPELTGRENVFLNGVILGMSRREVAKRFDAIVQFAEVEKFLDTPVKHYSSGMFMRLAFAVAAHLETEILIVDEVLAVGDAEFQKKCLGKMSEVSRGGRTVLFVSHNMAAVQKLCSRGLVLHAGRVDLDGTADEAVRRYLSVAQATAGRLTDAGRTHGPRAVAVRDGWLEQHGQPTGRTAGSDGLTLVVVLEVLEPITFVVELVLRQQDGVPVAFGSSGLVQRLEVPGRPGWYTARCRLPPLTLATGEYALDVIASELNVGYLDYLESAVRFAVDSAAVGEQGWNYSQSFGRGCLYWDVRYAVEPGRP